MARVHAGNGVALQPLRERFAASGLTAYEVARRMGWFKTSPDIHRLHRLLAQEHTNLERAQELCEALNLEPVDVGL